MELFVIVLCLLSERFWAHIRLHSRFHWFIAYGRRLSFIQSSAFSRLSPWVVLAFTVLPIWLGVMLVWQCFDHLLFGVLGLLFSFGIFYYCLGPVNPFYPVHEKAAAHLTDDDLGVYLAQVNGQLFAVLFWYLVAGPLGLVAYRLISVSQGLPAVHREASILTLWLDWIPARMTALLYLLVGSFQAGFSVYRQHFLSRPAQNDLLLSQCGLAALSLEHRKKKSMRHAERLVEHATILLLVVIALCTLVAWF